MTALDPSLAASDRSLLRRLHSGERAAFDVLYERYAEKLLTLARVNIGADLSCRLDPEDILQSVFRTFFRRANRGEYDLPDDEGLWKLLLAIGLNKIRAKGALHRAGLRDARKTIHGEAADEFLRVLPAADEAGLHELRLAIREALDELPASQRVILEHRMSGEPVDVIAARTGRSKRTVERAIQDFCRLVREMIGTGG